MMMGQEDPQGEAEPGQESQPEQQEAEPEQQETESVAKREAQAETQPTRQAGRSPAGAEAAGGQGEDDSDDIYWISGTVRGRAQEKLHEARVVVWWQHMRKRTELAAGETSRHGGYRLGYRIPKHAPEPVLLVVEALSEHLDAPLFSPLTTARPQLEVNLSFTKPDESEWAVLVRAIEPLLDGVQLDALVQDGTHQDISFLARELKQNTEVLMRVAIAARLEAAFQIPAPAFYAFLCQRVPPSLPSPLLEASSEFTLIDPLVQTIGSLIFGLSAEAQTQALTAAVALDSIGPQFTAQIPEIVRELQSHHTSDLLGQPYLVGNATLTELLDVAGVAQAKQQTFAQALATNTESMRNFWRKLGEGQSGFTAAEASTIERTLSIGAFVKNFVPLVESLLGQFSAGALQALPDLARLSKQEWVALIDKTGAPPGVDAAGEATPAEVFASVVYTRVTRTYPTAALSGRITAGTFVPQALQGPLSAFFEGNPDLELLKDNIPAYLATQGEKAFAGVAAAEQAAVVAYARSFQRVLRVAPTPDVAETLLDIGITSASQINSMGEQQFFWKATAAGLTKTEANAAFHVAARRYAGVISTYMQLNRGSLGLWPAALGDIASLNAPVQQAVARDQSLQTLFGNQDYCATSECTSILSPAAYLCDLLLWLRNHQQGSQTALDVLDKRRPDIRNLLLNCPNTDTELPYIDLVNELLADKISPPIDEVATSYVQEALVDGTAYYYIVTAVNSLGEGPASAQVSATPQAPTALPTAPTGVTATAGETEVTLAWSPVEGATGYNVYWSTSSGLTTADGTKVIAVTAPYVQEALVDGTAYYYIVTAVNSLGEGPASAQVSATPQAPTALPTAPTGVTATAGETEVTLAWSPVEGATGYNVYWSTSSGLTTADGTKVIAVTAPYVQEALVDGTAYYYIVTAVNSLGEGTASAQVSATPQAPTALPTAPTGVTATAGETEVTLAWSPVEGATGYNVYWSTSSGLTTTTGTAITGTRNPKWKQTSQDKTGAQLSAAPEYFNQGAYVTLFAASYPFSLPYSAGLDELRTYLQNLKLPLWQLRQALLPLSGASTAQQAAVAAERLGLAPHALELVANANFVEAAVVWNIPSPETAVAPVAAFLQAASITYESLLELLEVAWVQDGLGVLIQGIDDTCAISSQHLTPLTGEFLDRAHRFLRLWMALGAKMWELDLLLNAPAVGNGTLDEAALAALLAFQRLQDQTKLTVDQQLAFYQDIDVATHREPNGSASTSLYAQIFLNTAVTSVVPDPDLQAIATDGVAAKPALSEHLPGVQAALGVAAAEAEMLISLTDGQLTLSNLSLIYRVQILASVAQYPIADLLELANLLSPTAGSSTAALAPLFASPSATIEFLEQASSIRQSTITLDAATYVLTPPSATTLAAAVTAEQTTITVASSAGFPAANFYVSIGSEILLVTAVAGTGDTEWTVQRGQQGTTAATAESAAAVALVGLWATTTQMTEADIAATLATVQQGVLSLLSASTTLTAPIIETDTTIMVAADTGFPAPEFSVAIGSEILLVTAVAGTGGTEWTVARGQQGTTAAPAAAGAAVTPTGGDIDGTVIAAVAANAHTASASAVANNIGALVLERLQVPGTSLTLLEALTDPAFTGSTAALTPADFPDQFLAIQLFDKVAVLVRVLRLVATELEWLLANAAVYDGLQLTAFPVTTGQPALSLRPLLSTLLLVKLARLWTAAAPTSTVQTLYGLISEVSAGTLQDAPAAQTALASITGWPLADIASFTAALGMAFPAAHTQPAAYDAVRTLEQMATTAHATAAQLVDWATAPPDESTAEGLAAGALGVVKAQQPGEEAWLTLAAKLMDPIRERRSAALQAYLIGQRDSTGKLVYQDTDGLFDYFLIDVQMSSCEQTSRVVQAYLAIQIFVERCLLGLEAPEVVVDLEKDETWEQWQWMSRYRVWEANREVFLYPENWLIESQRPTRTEIFKTLEQEVQQGESTDEYLETVVLNYIQRLDGIAHLLVTGTCEDPVTGDIYVVARTSADPPTFYIRSYSGGAWGGWEKIPLNVKAQQVVPALYRGRVCLFWLEVKVATEPQQPLGAPLEASTPPNQVPDRYAILTVNFSMFQNGGWTPTQAATGKLFDKPFYGATAKADSRTTEMLYTLKVQSPATAAGAGAKLFVDVFRLGEFHSIEFDVSLEIPSQIISIGFGGLEAGGGAGAGARKSSSTTSRASTMASPSRSGERCSTPSSATSSCATSRSPGRPS